MAESAILLTPVGRLVAGGLYNPQTTDAEGLPLVTKSGPNAGKPRVDFFFAIAIPKGTETHWMETPWGKIIKATGEASFPGGQTRIPTFAWKVSDGDSDVPNRRGRAPRSRDGYPGCWVVAFSSGFPPTVCNATGTQVLQEPGVVKMGYYIQVSGSVAGNGSANQPGVFLNHNMVAMAAYGPEIAVGPDPTSVGFGQAPLPAGASATPIGALSLAAEPVGGRVASAPAPVPTAPHPAILAPPAAAAPPPPPPPPPAPPARVMLPTAGGATYEQLIGAGWTDTLLVQHGMMAA